MHNRGKHLLIIILLIVLSSRLVFALPLNEIYFIVEHNTISEIDPARLRETPVEKLPEYLNDPYFKYFDPETFREYISSYQGVYGGIGTQIARLGDTTFVENVYPGSPAAEAGIVKGDIIVQVDDKPVRDLSIETVASLIRGEPDSEVSLILLRGQTQIVVTVVRQLISSLTVEGQMLGETGIITIHNFQDVTPDQFREALSVLRAKEPLGYVIDLRNNPGGSVASVLEVAREIVPTGTLVTLIDGRGRETVYVSYADPLPLGKVVVLVNEKTASAAEILAAAIRDRGVGVLIGEKTYGKATVQSIYGLADGGGLRLTTAHYFTPFGVAINEIGLEPDVTVSGREAQLTEAISHFFELQPSSLVFTLDSYDVFLKETVREMQLVSDYPPFLLNSRTYVPLRLLAESMGLTVEWNQNTFEVTLRGESVEINIPIGHDFGLRNGSEFPLLGQAVLRNDRTFIPVRSVAEALGSRVYWEGETRKVTIIWE